MGWGCSKHKMDEGSFNYLNEMLADMVNLPEAGARQACPACLLEIVRMYHIEVKDVPERYKLLSTTEALVSFVVAQAILDDTGVKAGKLSERLLLVTDIVADAAEIADKLDKADIDTLVRLLHKLRATIKRARGEA